MRSANTFYQIVLDAGSSTGDYPRGYQVHVSNDGANWGSPIASGSGSSAVTTIAFPTQAARYVRVTQTGNTGPWWSIHEFNVFGTGGTAPAAPTGFTTVAGTNQIALSWTAASGAAGYNLKRSTTNGGPYSVIASNLAALVYTDTGLVNNTTYYFVVSAVNAVGEGGNSASASAMLPKPLPLSARALSSSQIQLSWTTNDNGGTFKAYYASALTPPVGWTPATNTPVLVNDQWTITLPIGTNDSGFYRLQQ
jgi:hypothetical protein